MRADEIANLFAANPGPAVGFRQGVIRDWNPATAQNTVEVGGTMLTDVPLVNSSEALMLQVGDVVGVLTAGASWWIIGRITVPGSGQLRTLGTGMRVAEVLGSTIIAGTTFALNSGPVLADVQVLATGKVYATVTAGSDLNIGEGLDLVLVGFGPGGVTYDGGSWGPSSSNSLTVTSGSIGGGLTIPIAASKMIEGLTPGPWRFEHWSRRVGTGGDGPNVYNRVLSILPV